MGTEIARVRRAVALAMPYTVSMRETGHGYILVDHGSRVDASNEMLVRIANAFRRHSGFSIVEPAHMELAEPSIRVAFDRCVAQGATKVVVCPFFLLPGRHWSHDIPALTQAAAEAHPGVAYLVTAPLGLLPNMLDLILCQIEQCENHAQGGTPCDLCADNQRCQFQEGDRAR